ncbi:MAG: hypothetical protein RL318_2946 [Fibrobacterota bacterium]|jgi:hypothetical protein
MSVKPDAAKLLEDLHRGALKGCRELSLNAGLAEIPEALLALGDTLEVLDLSGNELSDLPDAFEQMRALKILFLSKNRFEHVPEVLARLPNLEMIGFKSNRIATLSPTCLPPRTRWLILTDNILEDLPDTLGDLPRLQKLMLAGNRLRCVPHSLSKCRNLELIRLAANRLEEFPAFLLSLPRLSWLALSGNPCCPAVPEPDQGKAVDWAHLEVGEVLGQGASGVISKVRIKGDLTESVKDSEAALKLFKGEMTSDGLPAEEMAACLAAGRHPNLVPLIGRLTGHPSGTKGLVLGLIPPHYANLGGPPSYVTCTRDTYPEGTEFPLGTVRRILAGIADLLTHLHKAGLCHGDLYAHNILVDAQGHALLGDFGAAGITRGYPEKVVEGLERLEVRAFGCLMDDLLTRMPSEDLASAHDLLELRDQCLGELPGSRPEFFRVREVLTGEAP